MKVFDVVREREIWIAALRRKVKVLSLISSSVSEAAAFDRLHHLRRNDAQGSYHLIAWHDIEEKARLRPILDFILARRHR
jgi:hypothetical protein